jgi:large subunit ribosomal protein L9
VARMKVVLREVVPQLGEPGEVVTVSGGYARNYLIPRGMAVVANKGNLKQAEDWKNSKAAQLARARANAEQLKGQLESASLKVTAQAGPDGQLFGQVTAANLAEAIEAQIGATVDRHTIEIADPIRHTGVHEASVSLSSELQARLTIEVEAAG